MTNPARVAPRVSTILRPARTAASTVGGMAAFVLLAAAAGLACGATDDGQDGQDGSLDADIETYRDLGDSVQTETSSYATAMAGLDATMGCADVHDAYGRRAQPWVAQMGEMSERMDEYMRGHGGMATADHACATATMMEEFDYHHSVACTFTDLPAMKAEARRHAEAIAAYGDHVRVRCDEMLGVSGGASPHWGPMMDGCQAWDGLCSGMMHRECCSGESHHECGDWGGWGDCDHGAACW